MRFIFVVLYLSSFIAMGSDLDASFRLIHELSQAETKLFSNRKIYTTQIKPHLDNEYSGYHSRYALYSDNSFLARLTYEEVVLFAELCDLIYVNKYKNLQEIETGLLEALQDEKYKAYQIVGTIARKNGTELSAMLLYNEQKNHLIVVFRGSVTTTDWSQNLSFKNYSGQDAEALSFLDGTNPNIHQGFAQIYLEGLKREFHNVFQHVLEAHGDTIFNFDANPFRITTIGHSLGGALALIQANNLPTILLETGLFTDPSQYIIETLNFGMPRVYDLDSSKKAVENIGGQHNVICFKDDADPVPTLPPTSFGGADIGTPIRIKASVETMAANIINSFLPAFLAPEVIGNPLRHSMTHYKEKAPDVFRKIKEELSFASQANKEIRKARKLLQYSIEESWDRAEHRSLYAQELQRVNNLRDYYGSQSIFLQKGLEFFQRGDQAHTKNEQVRQKLLNLEKAKQALQEKL